MLSEKKSPTILVANSNERNLLTALAYDIKTTLRRLMTFGLVGVIGTAAHYLALVLLVELTGMDPVTATSVGFVIGALVNYVLNRRYTFRSSKAHLDAGPKFFLIAIVTGTLNSLLVYAGVSLLGANYLVVQIGATLIVFLFNFALNSLWTFQEAHAA
ncbi:MAG TPA: GtrA family protein [Sedimentisphaerales bacterium]|nr:GtrA family protein [Sedimentisphaerales bacterium]